MQNIFNKKITPQNNYYLFHDRHCYRYWGYSMNKTGRNPCLHGINYLVEDFLGHLLGKEFQRNILYAINPREVSPHFICLYLCMEKISNGIRVNICIRKNPLSAWKRRSFYSWFLLWKAPKRLFQMGHLLPTEFHMLASQNAIKTRRLQMVASS